MYAFRWYAHAANRALCSVWLRRISCLRPRHPTCATSSLRHSAPACAGRTPGTTLGSTSTSAGNSYAPPNRRPGWRGSRDSADRQALRNAEERAPDGRGRFHLQGPADREDQNRLERRHPTSWHPVCPVASRTQIAKAKSSPAWATRRKRHSTHISFLKFR